MNSPIVRRVRFASEPTVYEDPEVLALRRRRVIIPIRTCFLGRRVTMAVTGIVLLIIIITVILLNVNQPSETPPSPTKNIDNPVTHDQINRILQDQLSRQGSSDGLLKRSLRNKRDEHRHEQPVFKTTKESSKTEEDPGNLQDDSMKVDSEELEKFARDYEVLRILIEVDDEESFQEYLLWRKRENIYGTPGGISKQGSQPNLEDRQLPSTRISGVSVGAKQAIQQLQHVQAVADLSDKRRSHVIPKAGLKKRARRFESSEDGRGPSHRQRIVKIQKKGNRKQKNAVVLKKTSARSG